MVPDPRLVGIGAKLMKLGMRCGSPRLMSLSLPRSQGEWPEQGPSRFSRISTEPGHSDALRRREVAPRREVARPGLATACPRPIRSFCYSLRVSWEAEPEMTVGTLTGNGRQACHFPAAHAGPEEQSPGESTPVPV